MRAFVIVAHPKKDSLTSSLAEVSRASFRDRGIACDETDLYAQGWESALTAKELDYYFTEDPQRTDVTRAMTRSDATPDIAREQEKLARADTIVMHFPLWWYHMPAILKGWIDRVFTYGFASGLRAPDGSNRRFGDGGLVGKRALLVINAGDRPTSFAPRGINGPGAELLFPMLHGVLWYTGIAALEPHIIGGVDRPGWDQFDVEVARLRRRLEGIDEEAPLPYRTLASGDYDELRVLRDEIEPGRSGLAIHLRRDDEQSQRE